MSARPAHGEIAAAAAVLKAGGVVAFPTETVYGLGAEVSHPSAIKRIFDIKRRPYDHPLIVHIADASRLQYWANGDTAGSLAIGRALLAGSAHLDIAAQPPCAEKHNGRAKYGGPARTRPPRGA